MVTEQLTFQNGGARLDIEDGAIRCSAGSGHFNCDDAELTASDARAFAKALMEAADEIALEDPAALIRRCGETLTAVAARLNPKDVAERALLGAIIDDRETW